MFGKKKESGLAVQHYEGIEQFAKDYPCRLELDADMLTITRIKPETTVTLPRNICLLFLFSYTLVSESVNCLTWKRKTFTWMKDGSM